MPNVSLFRRACLLLAPMLLLPAMAHAATPANLAISQVFGAGGNTGSTIAYDFVELVNPTAAPLALTGYSLQYASATGTTYQVAPLPAVTLQPGEYFLVGASAAGTPTGGSNSIPSDAALNINPTGTPSYLAMAAGAGKIALVSSTTALSGSSGCPAGPSVIDFVGYGSTATCFTGTGPTATLSATLAAIRTNPCVAPTSNATDFAALAPAPHNSTSPTLSCSATASTSLQVTSNSIYANTLTTGTTILLSVRVTPATNPASSGIAVSANLSALNPSASTAQPFFDDGTNGDATPGDNIFSYTVNVTNAGTFSLLVTVTDAQARTATTTIPLTFVAPPPYASIRTLQAQKPGPYYQNLVTTSGIVVGVKASGFYLESADADTTPTTPEGILVYTGSSAKPSYIALGNLVQVSGTVANYASTPSLTPDTELDSPFNYGLISTHNTLPAPVPLTAAQDSPTGGIRQFTPYEGMRVSIASLTTTSGTGASLNEATETNTSNGLFYGVVTGIPRPFREPGISVNDLAFGTPPATVPLWDSNPELLAIDSLAFGAPALDLTSNVTLTGISGVMDFSTGTPTILLDAATRPTITTPLMTAVPIRAPAPTEFTVASFNMERFYNDLADADNPGSTAVTVSTAAYQRRLAKASLAIRNILNFPDILGAQEIENLAVLTDLANKISADALAANQSDPVYLPYLFLATDGTAINTGFLVKSTRVTTVRAEQFGLATTFTNATGAQAILNDRTPLVLHAGIKLGGTLPDYPITVIDVHQRSLINVDDPTATGQTVRLKREAQSEYLAKLIQGYQISGEHVIALGDFNAFQFSDGFVDSLGVIEGTPVPAAQVVTPPVSGLASPALVDLVTLLPAAKKQSYVESGSAQVLDHIVVTPDLVPSETTLVYAHMDSDFPLVYLNDATRPERVSDHDPVVAFFNLPALPAPVLSLSTTTLAFGTQLVGSTSATMSITLTNNGNTTLTLSTTLPTNPSFISLTTCTATLAPAATCTLTVAFNPNTPGPITGSLFIITNAAGSPATITLTGTGIAPSLTLSTTTLAFGNQLVGTTSAPMTVTLTNNGTATLTNLIVLVPVGAFQYPATPTPCGNSLLAGASCTLNVTFSPTSTGSATARIGISALPTITPLYITLSGTGIAPAATLSATALSFGSQVITTTSSMSSTLSNPGSAPLTITSISATGAGFSQTNTCGASLAPAATCTVTAVFLPAVSGAATGSITIATNAPGSPATIALTGSGGDFTFTATPTTATVAPGGTATYTLTATSLGGYAGVIILNGSSLAVGEQGTIPTLSLAANGSATGTYTLSTTTQTLPAAHSSHTSARVLPTPKTKKISEIETASLALGSLALLSLAGALRRKAFHHTARLFSLALLLGLGSLLSGCSNGPSTKPNPGGTPSGTQTITFTATTSPAGATHTLTLTLIVQ